MQLVCSETCFPPFQIDLSCEISCSSTNTIDNERLHTLQHLEYANICSSWKQTPLCGLQISDSLWRGWPCWIFRWPVEWGKSCAYQCYNAFFLQIFWRNLVLWSSQEERETSTSFTSCYLEHQMKHLVSDNKLLHALSLALLYTALHMTIILMHGVMQSWGKRRFLFIFFKWKGKPWVTGPAAIVLTCFTGPWPLLTYLL